MDAKMAADAALDASSFEPLCDIVQEGDSDTILVYLPGFKKEQLRVQLTKSAILKISGSRPTGENKWSSFQKDFPVSANCIIDKISAKFEDGILYVKQPKLIVPADRKEEKETPHEPPPQKPEQEQAPETTPLEQPENKEAKTAKNEQEKVSEAKETEKEEEKNSNNQNRRHVSGKAKAGDYEMARQKVTVVAAMLLAFALGIYISNLLSVFFGKKED